MKQKQTRRGVLHSSPSRGDDLAEHKDAYRIDKVQDRDEHRTSARRV